MNTTQSASRIVRMCTEDVAYPTQDPAVRDKARVWEVYERIVIETPRLTISETLEMARVVVATEIIEGHR